MECMSSLPSVYGLKLSNVDLRFLLAKLYMDSLLSKPTPGDIEDALKHLPRGIRGLDTMYEQAMERINNQIEGSQALANKVLSWITHAKRPLTSAELQHALAVRNGAVNLNEKFVPEIEDLVSDCAGLVTVDEESNIIRLVHYTTQEYFERTWISWFPNAQRDIAMTCVLYLSFDTFQTGFCPTDEDFEARLQSNPLYDYAAQNWGHHARAASEEQLILSFLESEAKVSASSQAMMAFKSYSSGSGYSQRVPRQVTGLHLAAYFGLENVVRALLKDGVDLDSKDTYYGETPLWWAAVDGHEAVVKLLLAADGRVDPDSKSKSGQTPLSWAAQKGHEAVVKLLLADSRVDPDSRYKNGRTPLSLAAVKGHEAVVKLLLADHRVNPDSKEKNGRTALSLAAAKGNEAVVKLLLADDRVDPDSKATSEYNDGWTPLSWVAEKGHEAVVKLLLTDHRVNPDSKEKNGRTALSLAAAKGHGAVVKLLLADDRVDVDSKDKNGRTPLSLAAAKGHEAVVKLLLADSRVDPDSKYKNGRTPLSLAAAKGHEAVVKLLLTDNRVDPDSKDKNGRTPLSLAVARRHKVVVKLLSNLTRIT
jgi:ankyrin repeat protein